MPECKQCGKRGLFLTLDENGLCNACRNQRFTIDFVNIRGGEYKDVTVTFSRCEILIDDTPTQISVEYIDNIGPSSDNKYERLATPDSCFWVSPSQFASFKTALNALRSNIELSYMQQPSNVIKFEQYLRDDQDFISIPVRFNVSGTSHSYGVNAYSIIESLKIGSKVHLELRPSSGDSNNTALVKDPQGRQFGVAHIQDFSSEISSELLCQLKSGVVQSASVTNKGLVSGKPIYWCEVELDFKFPYPKGEQLVFVANSGYLYHASKSCKTTANKCVPLSYAKATGRTPCKKCCGER